MFLASNCLVAMLLAILIFVMTAYFSLPVRSPSEGWRVARRMLSGLFGRGKPVAFVREGRLIHPDNEINKAAPRLALVDLTSTVVLGSPPGVDVVHQNDKRQVRKPKETVQKHRSRVVGSGLVFVGDGESLRGVTSLRKQVRLAPGIQCRTSDGIEYRTNLLVTFSLVQSPAVVYVGYLGKKPEDLRILDIDPQTGALLSAADELEEQDKAELYIFNRSRQNDGLPSTELVKDEPVKEYPPYHLDSAVKRRIASAAYYHPVNVHDRTRDDWTDLPMEEAIRIFRNMLAQVTYDELFMPNQQFKFPLAESFKPRFSRAVRNQGLLAYQLVRRVDGLPLEVGQKIDQSGCRIFPVQELKARTILREHGIKIISAGFSELDPGEAIRQQRLDNWQARWQRKVEIERANQDLEMMRIKNHARAEAQRAMVFQLSQILQSTPHSEETLTMRIFQALESAATDPTTRQLLPRDAFALLRSLRQWLLPDDQTPVEGVE